MVIFFKSESVLLSSDFSEALAKEKLYRELKVVWS